MFVLKAIYAQWKFSGEFPFKLLINIPRLGLKFNEYMRDTI